MASNHSGRERDRMDLTFLGKETKEDESPTLYETDRNSGRLFTVGGLAP